VGVSAAEAERFASEFIRSERFRESFLAALGPCDPIAQSVRAGKYDDLQPANHLAVEDPKGTLAADLERIGRFVLAADVRHNKYPF